MRLLYLVVAGLQIVALSGCRSFPFNFAAPPVQELNGVVRKEIFNGVPLCVLYLAQGGSVRLVSRGKEDFEYNRFATHIGQVVRVRGVMKGNSLTMEDANRRRESGPAFWRNELLAVRRISPLKR